MNRDVGKCLICNRLFQAADKNCGTLQIAELTSPVEMCDYHLEGLRHLVAVGEAIAKARSKP